MIKSEIYCEVPIRRDRCLHVRARMQAQAGQGGLIQANAEVSGGAIAEEDLGRINLGIL